MSLHELIDQAYQKFLEQAKNARVILLHPQGRYRSIVVARLVNAPDLRVFYHALGPDDIEIKAFISSITHDLASQHPTFGRHVNMLPQSIYEDFDKNFDLLLDTFVVDLSELSVEPFFFILDEYDRSDIADDIQRFIEKLAGRLPENCRLVLNSRTLPRLPWVSLIARGDAVLLEDTKIIRDEFYGIKSDSSSRLEIFALGPGFVLLNSQPIDTWEGHLPRLLFFFALDRPVVTRSEICQAFWPELDPDQAVNVFHVTKRRLHKALDMDVLIHDDGYYRVNPDMGLYYDVLDFVNTLINGRSPDNPNRVKLWQRAIDLYRGPFLQGHNDKWILDRRHDFQTGYLEALTNMARVWMERERHDQALALFQRALAEDYNREDIHREIMQLFVQMGRRSEAAAHYKRLMEDRRKQTREPAPETQALYAEIMA